MLAAVLHLSTAMPKPSAAALKPAAQMDATLVTKLNSGGWKCARPSMSHPAPSPTLSHLFYSGAGRRGFNAHHHASSFV